MTAAGQLNTHSSGTLLYSRATKTVRHDPPPSRRRRAIPACPKYRTATGTAMTGYGNNDTSVIRSPAIKKAGRLDAYGAASQAAA